MTTSNRQARINRLKEAFQKVEQLMNEGYVVQWDGEVVERVVVDNESVGLRFEDGVTAWLFMWFGKEEFGVLCNLTIAEINKELAERLTVWKRVEIKL